ncbi:MAG TPA: hemerythrin domain-containing protein [Myxococcaceae bacterium]|nr:hemerythrin domain-containing protein [Myxococcaceae bacterium]
MDAIDYLKAQHREVEALLEQLLEDEGEALDLDERRVLFLQVADLLSAHTEIEEDTFYPAVRAEDTQSLLREAVEEHLSVKRLLVDLLNMEPDDERFIAALTTLKEQVAHHVEEEEKELMPKARSNLSREALEDLHETISADFDALMAEEPHEKLIDEVGAPAPI